MFRLVIISLVFIIILRAEAKVPETENPEIRLSYSFHREDNYTVWKDKPLKIVIENAYARYIWCVNTYAKYVGASLIYEKFVADTEFSNDTVNILNIKNVTAVMSTRWKCTVLQVYHRPAMPYIYRNRNYIAKELYFNLYVKGARAVNLTANNQSLTYVTTDLSVNYDGEANYTYEDGDDFLMDFSCKKADDNRKDDTLRLEYYNAEGILLFQTKPREKQPHIFRSVLKSNNDKYYLDCIRAARNPDREYRYRTMFIKRDLHADAEERAVLIFVNGKKISSFVNNDKSYEYYIFKYIYGEVLNVTCRKMDVNMRGSLSFSSDANITSETLRSSSEAVIISINTSTSDIKNKSLICSINNTDVEKPNARLLFFSDVRDHDVRIRGLRRNNILYQYTNDEYQWSIEYQYYVNDTLNLTCLANGGFHGPNQRQQRPYTNPFVWKFEGKLIDSAAKETRDTQIKFSEIPFTKILDTTHDGTKIKCTYFPNVDDCYINRTVEIILRLKPELVSEAADDISGNNSEPPIVPIAIGVGVAIFIITMVCLVLWRGRTKRLNLIQNAYDNLSNQNDSPIPAFPSQWEANYGDSNYAKIDEGVMQENYNYSTHNDKLYGNSMPHKRQSNTSENVYTEIDDYLKPKPDGLAANSNTAHPVNYNKKTDTHKSTASHSSNNAIYNNFCNTKQGTYENLRHNNLPISNSNENYSNVKKPSKSKSVTFRQMSNDLRPGRNYSEGNSRQGDRNTERKFKPNNDSYYANTGQNTNMQPWDMHKKPNYENHFLPNEKPDKPLDSDYAEPYDDLGVSCKNDFYRLSDKQINIIL